MAWRKPTNLKEWLGVICRHQKKAFFPAVAVMIIVMIASHQIPRVYRAEAKFQRRNDAALQQMGDRTIDQNLNPIRRALTEDLKGRTAIEQVVDDLQLTRDLPHTPDGQLTREGQMRKMDMVRQLQDRINVWFTIKSDEVDQICVSYTDTDRVLAPKIVNTLVENYIRKTRQELDEALLNAQTFFDREVQRYRTRVAELESKKLKFEMDHPGLAPDDPSSNQNKLLELRAQMAQAKQELKVTQQKHASLKAWVDGQPTFIEQKRRGQNPVLTDLLNRKTALENELEEHLMHWGRTDDHPLVVKTRRRLEEIDAKIKETPTEAVIGTDQSPNQSRMAAEQQVQMLEGTMVALSRQVEELAQQTEEYEVRNRNLFVVRNDYVKIEREYAEAQQQLEFWENNLRQTSVALRAEIGQRGVRLSVIQRAPDMARPSEPTLAGIIGMALVLGLGVAGAVIFLSEVADRSFRDVEHAIDELKLPVLGTVNEIFTERQIVQQKMWNWGIFPSLGAAMIIVLAVSIALTYLSLNEPQKFDRLFGASGHTTSSLVAGSTTPIDR